MWCRGRRESCSCSWTCAGAFCTPFVPSDTCADPPCGQASLLICLAAQRDRVVAWLYFLNAGRVFAAVSTRPVLSSSMLRQTKALQLWHNYCVSFSCSHPARL